MLTQARQVAHLRPGQGGAAARDRYPRQGRLARPRARPRRHGALSCWPVETDRSRACPHGNPQREFEARAAEAELDAAADAILQIIYPARGPCELPPPGARCELRLLARGRLRKLKARGKRREMQPYNQRSQTHAAWGAHPRVLRHC